MSISIDEITIILKFCSFKTLLKIKFVNKLCLYLVNLELNQRIKMTPLTSTVITKDFLEPNYILKFIKNASDLSEQLRLLSILYKIYNSFEPFDWDCYELPMKILYMSTDEDFKIYFNHWLIQDYLKDIPGLWSREEIFMTWYDKMDSTRQLILKKHVLKIYGCPEEYIYILHR